MPSSIQSPSGRLGRSEEAYEGCQSTTDGEGIGLPKRSLCHRARGLEHQQWDRTHEDGRRRSPTAGHTWRQQLGVPVVAGQRPALLCVLRASVFVEDFDAALQG